MIWFIEDPFITLKELKEVLKDEGSVVPYDLSFHSIDRLLESSKKAREVTMVGPTASMIPDPLFRRGATTRGGIKVVEVDRLLQAISEGGGVPQFKKVSRQIAIKAAPENS